MGNLANFATALIATAPSPATSGPSLVVEAGKGVRFPAVPFYATLHQKNQIPTFDNAEVVLVTARSTDTMTITRAQKTTTAQTVLGGNDWRMSNTIFVEDMFNGSVVENEVPTGSINGSNTAFTVATAGKVTGTLKVYKNGIRLKAGGADFTETATGFTMVTAPATGTVLLCDYRVGGVSDYNVGSNSFVSDEAVTGSVNSSNTSFTTARQYIAGSLEVFINGLKQIRVTDYAETTPASGAFTMTVAPTTGDIIRVNYQYNLNPSSNSDTVDGYHADDMMPIGALLQYASDTLPSANWLLCYGQAISRTTYPVLFARLSTTYGVGDGSTTFNLPDLRGRVPAGQDDMGGSSANRLTNPGSTGGMDGDVLGGVGGQEAHTMTTAEMVAHSHTLSLNASSTAGGLAHYFAGNGAGSSAPSTSSVGSTTPFNVVQPTIILNYIIKAL